MTVFHIVSFKLSTGQDELSKLTKNILELKNGCQQGGKECIVSVKGGKQVSTEGKDRGMQVTFIMEFETDDTLQYYLWKCPAHQGFKDSLKDAGVQEVIALDFEDGKY